VGPRADLDDVENRKNLLPSAENRTPIPRPCIPSLYRLSYYGCFYLPITYKFMYLNLNYWNGLDEKVL
jgi:hypothetical protein